MLAMLCKLFVSDSRQTHSKCHHVIVWPPSSTRKIKNVERAHYDSTLTINLILRWWLIFYTKTIFFSGFTIYLRTEWLNFNQWITKTNIYYVLLHISFALIFNFKTCVNTHLRKKVELRLKYFIYKYYWSYLIQIVYSTFSWNRLTKLNVGEMF